MTSLVHRRPSQAADRNRVNVPYAEEILSIARGDCSFQTREVLQRMVTGEQQRIKEEQMFWRVGGALLGACFGLSDGFQYTDFFIGMAGASIASLSYEVMSHEDRQFLERCQLLWLVDRNSPIELSQRLGQARSRLVLFYSSWESPVIFNHHQGHRGDYLVPLGNAGNWAQGFSDQMSLEVLRRYFDHDDLETLQNQLYPIAQQAIHVQSVAPIAVTDAIANDPYAASFVSSSQPVLIQSDHSLAIGYQLPIPTSSDF